MVCVYVCVCWELRRGAAERLLAPSVHVLCIPALVFTQRGWCAQCSDEKGAERSRGEKKKNKKNLVSKNSTSTTVTLPSLATMTSSCAENPA